MPRRDPTIGGGIGDKHGESLTCCCTAHHPHHGGKPSQPQCRGNRTPLTPFCRRLPPIVQVASGVQSFASSSGGNSGTTHGAVVSRACQAALQQWPRVPAIVRAAISGLARCFFFAEMDERGGRSGGEGTTIHNGSRIEGCMSIYGNNGRSGGEGNSDWQAQVGAHLSWLVHSVVRRHAGDLDIVPSCLEALRVCLRFSRRLPADQSPSAPHHHQVLAVLFRSGHILSSSCLVLRESLELHARQHPGMHAGPGPEPLTGHHHILPPHGSVVLRTEHPPTMVSPKQRRNSNTKAACSIRFLALPLTVCSPLSL